MLTGLDASNYRDQSKWLEMMMACHHASAGEAREEFIAWSTSDPEYADDEYVIGRRWDSLHGDDGGKRVTVRTLFKALYDADHADLVEAVTRSTPLEDFPIGDLPDWSPPDSSGDRRIHALAEKWVWVTKAEQFVSRRDCQRLSPFQFKSHYQHLWKGKGDILASVWNGKLPISKYAHCVYVPGDGEVIAGGKWDGAYNTWRKGGSCPSRTTR
nr:PriCT-2 domain-containing protein [Sphingopyxis sp. BSNA05]